MSQIRLDGYQCEYTCHTKPRFQSCVIFQSAVRSQENPGSCVRKSDKMHGKPSILSLFVNSFNKSNKTALMLDAQCILRDQYSD